MTLASANSGLVPLPARPPEMTFSSTCGAPPNAVRATRSNSASPVITTIRALRKAGTGRLSSIVWHSQGQDYGDPAPLAAAGAAAVGWYWTELELVVCSGVVLLVR